MQRMILGLVFIQVLSCKEKRESTKPHAGGITEAVYAAGFVKSQGQYQVFPKSNGIIRKFYVQKGDIVSKGQIIASISSDVSKLNVENAELSAQFADYNANQNKISEAKSSLQLALKKLQSDSIVYQRQKRLWNEQIGTKFELEQRELQLTNSRTSFEAALYRLRELERQLKFNSEQSKKTERISKSFLTDYEVRSEKEGRIYTILKEEGEMAGPQSPIAILGDARNFYVLLQVDENDITKITPGQKVSLRLESYKNEVFEAVVTKVLPFMNERTRSFEVEATFTNAPPNLYPNLTLEANIIISKKDKTITIPRKYLTEDNEVWINKKDKRKVKTGLQDYDKVEIIEGLKENETIYLPQ